MEWNSVAVASVALVFSAGSLTVSIVTAVRNARRDPKPKMRVRFRFIEFSDNDDEGLSPALEVRVKNFGSVTAKEVRFALLSPGQRRAEEYLPAKLDPDKSRTWTFSLMPGDLVAPARGKYRAVFNWRHDPNDQRGQKTAVFHYPRDVKRVPDFR